MRHSDGGNGLTAFFPAHATTLWPLRRPAPHSRILLALVLPARVLVHFLVGVKAGVVGPQVIRLVHIRSLLTKTIEILSGEM